MDRMSDRKDSAASQGSEGSGFSPHHRRNASYTSQQSNSFESDDRSASMDDDYDPDLDDKDNEADSWSELVDQKYPKFRRTLNAKQIKRQGVIYELIQTESAYVRTLNIMKKIYYDGMKSEMNISDDDLTIIFPRLEDILELNGSFLRDMLVEQRAEGANYCVNRVGNIILKHFGGENGARFRETYGYFCSHHREAVALFKDYYKEYKEFQQFNDQCLQNSRARRLSVPECITYMTMRLTKYPLLIEAIIKATTAASSDYDDLKQSFDAVKEVLSGVDSYVNRYEQELELERIRNLIDNLSVVEIKGKDINVVEKQFKACKAIPKVTELLYDKRAKVRSNHKIYDVRMIIITNKIIFFQEHPSTKKLQLLNVDNKPPVIHLNEVINAKPNAADSNVVFIVTNVGLPEILFDKQKDKNEFISKLTDIKSNYVNGNEDELEEEEEEDMSADIEEEKKIMDEERLIQMKELVNKLQDTDHQIRTQLHSKNELVQKLRQMTSSEGGSDECDTEAPIKIPEDQVFSTKAKLEELLAEVNGVLVAGGSSQENTPPISPSVKRRGTTTPSPKVKHRETPVKKSDTFGGYERRKGSNVQKGIRAATLSTLITTGVAPNSEATAAATDSRSDSDPAPAKLSKQKQLKKLMTSSRSMGSTEDISSSRTSSTSSLSTFCPPTLSKVQVYQHLSEQLATLIEITNQQDLEMAKLHEEVSNYRLDRSVMEDEVSTLRQELRLQREESDKQLQQERERYAKLSNEYKRNREKNVRMPTAPNSTSRAHHQRHAADKVVEYQL